MFIPKYTITNKILKDIGIVEAAREVIMHAPLIPAWEAKFRKEAIERTIQQKKVTYDLARLMEGATELKTSQFADAIIGNM